jgi:uncharacterized protein YecT (DUF1311 family)
MRLDLEATVSDDAPLRASDAEREQTADALRDHYATGRLSAEEFDQRLDVAYKATTVAEPAQLRADLPELPAPPAARRAELSRRQAELRRQLVQQAGGSLTPFAICTLVWVASGADGAFWPVWVLSFPLVFVLRNIWRSHGAAPDLDRVQRELSHRARGGRRARYPRQLP